MSKVATIREGIEPGGRAGVEAEGSSRRSRGSWLNGFIPPTVLVALFVSLQCLLPLGSAVKIGADEDYELSKATLCLKGFHLYTQIWNDQPPLDTFVLTQILKHVSLSVLGPRLLTVSCAVLLLASTFALVRRASGALAAVLATAMFVASPGFLELSASCMQEIPALAPAVAGLASLWTGGSYPWFRREILSGILLGFALQMKLLDALYLPVAALILWLRSRESGLPLLGCFKSWFVFGMSVLTSFVALNYLTGNSLLIQFQQSWSAHFAANRSFE